MAKGAAAKELVIKKLQQAFGSDYIGELDKKIYVWSEENGERLQIAISLTCPKTPVVISNKPLNFEDKLNFEDGATIIPHPQMQTEISDEERQTVKELMERLGL